MFIHFQMFVMPLLHLTLIAAGASGAVRFKNLKFENYDTVIIPLVPIPYLPLWPPYHKMYAVSNTELFQLGVRRRGRKHETEIKIVNMDYFGRLEKSQKGAALKPDLSKGPIGWKGAVLARRMVGLKLPYRFITCNCYHYVDYLTYGKTFGRKLSWYGPVGDACPVFRDITPHTDVTARGFKLWDKAGKAYRLKSLKLRDYLTLF